MDTSAIGYITAHKKVCKALSGFFRCEYAGDIALGIAECRRQIPAGAFPTLKTGQFIELALVQSESYCHKPEPVTLSTLRHIRSIHELKTISMGAFSAPIFFLLKAEKFAYMLRFSFSGVNFITF